MMANRIDIYDFEGYLYDWMFYEDYKLTRDKSGTFNWILRVANDPEYPVSFFNGIPQNQKKVLHKKGNLAETFRYFCKKFAKVKTFSPHVLYEYMRCL